MKRAIPVELTATEYVSLEDFEDNDLIEEVIERNLQGQILPIGKTVDSDEIARQKVDLFTSHMPNLSWEQWNYIFKDVQRRTPAERAKMPKDYSLVLEESIS